MKKRRAQLRLNKFRHFTVENNLSASHPDDVIAPYPDGRPEKEDDHTLFTTDVVTIGNEAAGKHHIYATLTQQAHHDIFTVRQFRYDESVTHKYIGQFEPNIIHVQGTFRANRLSTAKSMINYLSDHFRNYNRQQEDIELEAYQRAQESLGRGKRILMALRQAFNLSVEGRVFENTCRPINSLPVMHHGNNNVQIPLIVPVVTSKFTYPDGFDKMSFMAESSEVVLTSPLPNQASFLEAGLRFQD